MGDLSEHFDRSEFACKCECGFDTVDYALLTALEGVRAYFGRPVLINSGCRCRAHNVAQGGAAGSMHLAGKAADIRVEGIEPLTVCKHLATKYHGKYGVKLYPGRVHFDVRPVEWREVGLR